MLDDATDELWGELRHAHIAGEACWLRRRLRSAGALPNGCWLPGVGVSAVSQQFYTYAVECADPGHGQPLLSSSNYYTPLWLVLRRVCADVPRWGDADVYTTLSKRFNEFQDKNKAAQYQRGGCRQSRLEPHA